MAPVGANYPTTAQGKLANWDDTTYSFKVPASAMSAVKLEVRLVYQTASKEYIDFLRSENTTNARGTDMTRIWENHGRGKYVVMATQTMMIPNTAPCVVSQEICNGLDDDCNGTIDDQCIPADDMGPPPPPSPPEDMSTEQTMEEPKSGCGVSVAGTAWGHVRFPAILIIGLLAALGRGYLRRRCRTSSIAFPRREIKSSR
jgi:hypothetical protein